jgi:hypothetical protein
VKTVPFVCALALSSDSRAMLCFRQIVLRCCDLPFYPQHGPLRQLKARCGPSKDNRRQWPQKPCCPCRLLTFPGHQKQTARSGLNEAATCALLVRLRTPPQKFTRCLKFKRLKDRRAKICLPLAEIRRQHAAKLCQLRANGYRQASSPLRLHIRRSALLPLQPARNP